MDDQVRWRIGLLGTFRIERDGEVVAVLYNRKRDRLLAYLAVAPGRPHLREDLSRRLWPNEARSEGLQRLSSLLYTLGAYFQEVGIDDDLVVRTYHTLQLNPRVCTDVQDFERLAQTDALGGATAIAEERLRRLGEVYGAGLLPLMRDAAFEPERLRLAMLHRQAVARIDTTIAHGFSAVSGMEPSASPEIPLEAANGLPFLSPFTEADRRRQQIMDLGRLIEDAMGGIWGAERAEWIHRLNARYPEICDALEWAITNDERDLAARLAGGLWPYWLDHPTLDDGRQYLERILAMGRPSDAEPYALAVHGSGVLSLRSGDLILARTRLHAAQALWQRLGQQTYYARAINSLGEVARRSGRPAEALPHFAQALEILRALPAPDLVCRVLNNAAAAETALGHHVEAQRCLEERLALGTQLGNQVVVARARADLANVLIATDQLALARTHAEAALSSFEEMGDDAGQASCLRSLGYILHRQARFDDCDALYQRSIDRARAAGDMAELSESLFYRASVRHDQGHVEEAIDLCRRAQDLFTAVGDAIGVAKVKRALEHLGVASPPDGAPSPVAEVPADAGAM